MKTKTIPCVERVENGFAGIFPTGPLAESIFKLTGRRHLTRQDLEALTDLGFVLKFVAEPKQQRRAA